MIILATITAIIVGWVGTAFGYEYMNFPQLGTILSVTTMRGFIMTTIKK